jgi:nucleoside 2-deoxyribosyltransferase
MHIYIASRWGRRDEALSYAEALERCGYTVTSTWIHQPVSEMYDNDSNESARGALKDLKEIRNSDALVYLSEDGGNPWGRGGRHVEFGYAVALSKRVMIVGPLENLFHFLPEVLQFDTIDDLFQYLKEEN